MVERRVGAAFPALRIPLVPLSAAASHAASDQQEQSDDEPDMQVDSQVSQDTLEIQRVTHNGHSIRNKANT
eukprot:1517533-Amphidinium_carterae.1